jgi:2-polyprenyl-6-methoxyphenol hydroxylase-like FAD-dependent oxidoreductase
MLPFTEGVADSRRAERKRLADRRLLWTFDTARAFDTVNAVPTRGGSIIAPGPTVAGGILFVGSGYGVVTDTPAMCCLLSAWNNRTRVDGAASAEQSVSDIEVPVLVVGGSLVGLSAAMLLAHHGVRSLAVEYHRGTAMHPRAAHATQRTMEIFRSVGLEEAIRKKSAEQFVQNGGVVAVDTLVGGVTKQFIADLNAGIRDVSPCERVFLSQSALEPLLSERALELGASLRFATEVMSAEEGPDGVTAQLRSRDKDDVSTVRAKYLIAADGAHSRIRQRLGIPMQGHPTFSKSITIYFHADLRPLLNDQQWAVVYVDNARLRGFFRFEKPFDRAFLVVNTAGEATHPMTDVSTGLSPERALEYVHTALGTRDIPVTIDNVMHWEAAAQVAARLQTSRVFIAGDAAHVMPPTGGFGGNTGVQDAHNLAWKLARVLNGSASASLLLTYEDERRPVASLSVEQAYTRYVLRTDPSLGKDLAQPLVGDLNIELGYRYRSAAILPEPNDDGSVHLNPRESRGLPGARAPHVWLKQRGKVISTLDLYDRHFVLLAGAEAHAWCDHGAAAAAVLGLALKIYRPGRDGLEDPDGQLGPAHGIKSDGCVLVRPDGFVAWRATTAQDASAQTLGKVLARLSFRTSSHISA